MVSSSVSLPRMISTSFILSTGLKKWMPTNLDGFALAWANPLMGRVEVLLAKKPPSASMGSASFVTIAFSSRCSNTASMIRSQPWRSAALAVGVMRLRMPCCFSADIWPLSTRFCVSFVVYDLPFSAASMLTSLSTVAMPLVACE